MQSSWNLFSERMGKTLVWHLLQKSSALHMNLVFKLRLSNDFTAAWLTFTFSQLFAVAATLKSIYYNVAITFILNNNNNNISWKGLLWCWAWPLAIAKFLVLPHHKYVCILPGKSIRWMHGVIGSSMLSRPGVLKTWVLILIQNLFFWKFLASKLKTLGFLITRIHIWLIQKHICYTQSNLTWKHSISSDNVFPMLDVWDIVKQSIGHQKNH